MPRPKRQFGKLPIERYVVMSQAEVGRRLGLSAMRICQIERTALAKLRTEFKKAGIGK